MTNSQGISELVINRLPRYHRFLGELLAQGVTRISSRELSEKMGFTASQIRQDLNCFGGFGQQGYGYQIEQLRNEIGNILGLNKSNRAILIGAGNLGRAIASHMNFEGKGFRLIGIFDKKEALKGQIIKDKVLFIPGGKGSTVGSYVIFQMMKNSTAPNAIICLNAEPIIATGAIMSDIPMVDSPSETKDLTNGTLVEVDGDAGTIELL